MSLDPAQVSACLVTRGDVDLSPILASFPPEYEVVVWDNSKRINIGVWGRYIAIAEATRPVIFVQDDDCIIRDHQRFLDAYEPGVVTGYVMDTDPGGPARRELHADTTLLGWGAIFDRELPALAFAKYKAAGYVFDDAFRQGLGAETIFPMLSRTKTLYGDVEWLREEDGEVFRRKNRMWLQPGFYSSRDWWLTFARDLRLRLEETLV